MPADRRGGLLAGVDAHRYARLPLGRPALARPPVSLGGVRVVGVGLVDPDAAPQHDAAPVAVDGGERAAWRLMRRASAQAPGGTANGAGPMRGTQVASGFLQPSRTVPVSDVDPAPHAGRLRLRTPEGPSPPLRAGEAPHRGRGGDGRDISAASAGAPKPSSSQSPRSSTASDGSSSSAGAGDPASPA